MSFCTFVDFVFVGLDQINEWSMECVMEALENQVCFLQEIVSKTTGSIFVSKHKAVVCHLLISCTHFSVCLSFVCCFSVYLSFVCCFSVCLSFVCCFSV